MFIYLICLLLSCVHPTDIRQTAGYVLIKEIAIICKSDDPTTCEMGGITAAGSAVRIKWKGDYFWLTAAHVCSPSDSMGIKSIARNLVITEGGSGESETILHATYNSGLDLCITPAKEGPTRVIAKNEPNLGENVSIIAYPGGAFSQTTLPIYDGRFMGHADNTCTTTIPVAGGSSGAGVLDNNGNVIGVISAVMRSFNHYTIIVCLEDLRSFLDQAAVQLKSASEEDVQTSETDQ